MARLDIRLPNSERAGFADVVGVETEAEMAEALASGRVIHLSDDAEIAVSGLAGGMASGKPSMAFCFKLPDGRVVIAETSWRLFAVAFWAFAAHFGDERPDTAGMAIGLETPGGGMMRLDVKDSDLPYMECELCGYRADASPDKNQADEALRVVAEFLEHFKTKHPEWSPPVQPPT